MMVERDDMPVAPNWRLCTSWLLLQPLGHHDSLTLITFRSGCDQQWPPATTVQYSYIRFKKKSQIIAKTKIVTTQDCCFFTPSTTQNYLVAECELQTGQYNFIGILLPKVKNKIRLQFELCWSSLPCCRAETSSFLCNLGLWDRCQWTAEPITWRDRYPSAGALIIQQGFFSQSQYQCSLSRL